MMIEPQGTAFPPAAKTEASKEVEMIVDPRDFTAEALGKIAAKCGECGGATVLVKAEVIYPNRPELWRRDGADRWYWRCSCGAYVGAHPNTIKPMGTAAGPATRQARSEAHAAFDPMWKKRAQLSGVTLNAARGRGYRWLAEQLGIDRKDCHIGEMDAAMARRVVEVVRAAREKSDA